MLLERFSIECCKTKIKVVIAANQNEGNIKEPIKTNKLTEARENANDQVTIDFSFESYWWRRWREFSLSEVNQNESNHGLLSTSIWK